MIIQVCIPRPCPEHLNQHFWGWHPEIGILARLPRDSEIKAGLKFGWVIHAGDGSVQGRQAVTWQKDQRPGTDRCIQLFPKLGGWASVGKGGLLKDREDWPSLWGLGRRLRGPPSHWPPFLRHQEAVMRLHPPFISIRFSSWGRRRPHCGSKELLPTVALGLKLTCFSLWLFGS